MTDETFSVVLVGVGGQGVLLASEILARSAMAAGYDVKTNEVHGMAQRGGSVVSHVRYGEEVHSPTVPLGTAQVLGSLERIEALRYAGYLSLDGLAVVSSQAVMPVTVSTGEAQYPKDGEARLREAFPRLVYLDAARVAVDLGSIKAANVVLLGAASRGLDLPLEAWREGISSSVRERHLELNLRAFDTGRNFK